jgi:hypothetical protein
MTAHFIPPLDAIKRRFQNAACLQPGGLMEIRTIPGKRAKKLCALR